MVAGSRGIRLAAEGDSLAIALVIQSETDLSEKDNIAWYSPGKNDHYIRGGFSKKMIDIYYSH